MQSLNTKFWELKIILSKYSPACKCLELITVIINPPSGSNIVHSNRVRDDGQNRGIDILINNQINHRNMQLYTNIHATSTTLFLGKQDAICNIYLPFIAVTKHDISSLS